MEEQQTVETKRKKEFVFGGNRGIMERKDLTLPNENEHLISKD